MSTPITWTNVNSNAAAGVGGLLDSARQGINEGFGAFNKVLADRQKQVDANWDNQSKVNTQALYTALGQARTPEEYAALQQSPEFQAQQAGMGAQYDQAAVRQFMDNRNSVLQQRVTNEGLFANQQQDLREHPVVQQIMALDATGDKAGADALRLANPGLRNFGQVAKEGAAAAQLLVTQGEARQKFAEDILTAQNQREVASSNAEANTSNADTNALEAQTRAVEHLANRAKAASDKDAERQLKLLNNTSLSRGYINSGEGNKALTEALSDKTLKFTGGQISDIYEKLAKIAPGGVYTYKNPEDKQVQVNVSTNAVVEAARGSDGSWNSGNLFRSNSFGNRLEAMLKLPSYQEDVAAAEQIIRNSVAEPGASGGKPPGPGERPLVSQDVTPEQQAVFDENTADFAKSLGVGLHVGAPASVLPLEKAAAKANAKPLGDVIGPTNEGPSSIIPGPPPETRSSGLSTKTNPAYTTWVMEYGPAYKKQQEDLKIAEAQEVLAARRFNPYLQRKRDLE